MDKLGICPGLAGKMSRELKSETQKIVLKPEIWNVGEDKFHKKIRPLRSR